MNAGHEANWEHLCKVVQEVMAREGVPGVAVGVLHEGEVVSAGFGVTNVDHPLPVTDETLFQVGSITKTFTGTAIMRLVEMGKLDLDATVRTYVPNFKVADETAAARVAIRHLLTHRAGWEGDFFHDTGAGDDASARYVADMADLAQIAPFDTVWSYNNAGFYLAGHIIELATGRSYQAALRELVLDPLGLKNSYFDPADVMTYRFAVGHEVQAKVAHVARPWPLPRAAYAAGGLACTVKDLLRYAQFHMGDGKSADGAQLLTPQSITHMQTPQLNIWGDKAMMGLSWFVDDVQGARQISHGGGTVGQVSQLLAIPERNFALAIFTNAGAGGNVTKQASRWALKEYLGLEVKDPSPRDASAEQLAEFSGRYVRSFLEVELGVIGGRLIAQLTFKAGFPTREVPPPPPPLPMPVGLCDEADRLIVLDGEGKGETADVIRNADGSIGWLRIGGRIVARPP